ncbi:hypothetical protein BASA81_004743 [Batrachochytrium salamandrivorans]|nr:hypothetical protein BASA81_004743 [Batrachochytrium salamandrivorans]
MLAVVLLVVFLTVQAVLHGEEADHSLEECTCCLPTPDCLFNVGPSPEATHANKTFQHLLFSSLSRELHGESFPVTSGQLPGYSAGSLFKNGFGKFETSNYKFLSVFDAMGYAIRIQFFPSNNSVSVTAKLTRSEWYNQSTAPEHPNTPTYRSFMGTDPPLTFMESVRLMTTILPDNLNVNLVRQGNKLLAISDMDGFNQLDFDSMEFLEYFRYSDALSMTSSALSLLGVLTSAHPVSTAKEPHIVYNYVGMPGGNLMQVLAFPLMATLFTLMSTNSLLRQLNVKQHRRLTAMLSLLCLGSILTWSFNAMDGYHPSKVNLFTIYRLDTSESSPLSRKVLASIPMSGFTYLHEMAITDRSLVLMEWPVTWSIQRIVSPVFNDPGKLQLDWKPWLGTKITVVDKHTGDVRNVVDSLGPYWSYHHIGAYETKDNVLVVDACTFNSGEHLHTFELRTLRKNSWEIPPNINRRFEIHVGANKVKVKNVGPVGFDLPVRNPEYVGRPYQFVYGTGHLRHGDWWNSLVKVDMDTGKTWQWYEQHTWPSQPVFVANPRRRAEDDGVLITIMLDGAHSRSFVLVLDAATMLEVARVNLDLILPYTSHGYFDVQYGGNAQATTIPGFQNGFYPAT